MYDDEDHNTFNRIEFSQTASCDGVFTNVSIVLNDKEYLGDIAQAFKNFLVAIGFDYVEGVTIHKGAGDITTEY